MLTSKVTSLSRSVGELHLTQTPKIPSDTLHWHRDNSPVQSAIAGGYSAHLARTDFSVDCMIKALLWLPQRCFYAASHIAFQCCTAECQLLRSCLLVAHPPSDVQYAARKALSCFTQLPWHA